MLPAAAPPFSGWRHHLARCSGGTMGVGQWRQFEFMAAEKRKPYNRASRGGKQANRLGGRWKCTPFGAAHHFPRRGKFALLSASAFISISKRSVAKISPSGGDVAAGDRRGAFPAGEARLYGFPAADRRQYTHRPQGDTTTLSHVVAVKPSPLA